MKSATTFLTVIIPVLTIISVVYSQGHYVPAYVWIPTLNVSNNHSSSAWNKTNNTNVYGGGGTWNNNNNNNNNYNNNNYRPPAFGGINSTGYNGTKDGHLFVGNIQPFDRQLFSQLYIKPGRWWSNREKIIEYPKDLPAGYNRHETISAVRIFNKFLDGNSATASIVKGGIGSQYVKIKLESKWGKGFSYLVQIYGH